MPFSPWQMLTFGRIGIPGMTPGINPNVPAGIMTGGVPLPQQQAMGGANPPPAPAAPVGPKWLQAFQGGFDKFANGLSGYTPNPNLSDAENQAIQKQQRMAAFAQLAEGSGPAPVGTRGLLQPFGEASMAGMQTGQSLADQALKAKLIQAQLQRAQAGGDPSADIQGYNLAKSQGYAGSYADWLREFKAREANVPAAVQIAKYYEGLDPEARKRFVEANRNIPIENINQVPTRVLPGGDQQPLSTQDSENAAAKSRSAAKTAGEAQGANQAGLEDSLADINKMRGDINNLITAPGFDAIYGLQGAVNPKNYIPGTDAANAQARRQTLSAESFGIAIQKMKGLGGLSNAEGAKVTDAFTRATNPKISAEEARQAWDEVNIYLDAAEARARKKATGGSVTPSNGGWKIEEVK